MDLSRYDFWQGEHDLVRFVPSPPMPPQLFFLGSQRNPGSNGVFDTKTWEWEPSQAHEEGVRGMALSPDGSMLATTGEDDFVRIRNLSDRDLLDKIPADFPSDAMWIDGDSMAIALADGARWRVVTHSEAVLLE